MSNRTLLRASGVWALFMAVCGIVIAATPAQAAFYTVEAESVCSGGVGPFPHAAASGGNAYEIKPKADLSGSNVATCTLTGFPAGDVRVYALAYSTAYSIDVFVGGTKWTTLSIPARATTERVYAGPVTALPAGATLTFREGTGYAYLDFIESTQTIPSPTPTPSPDPTTPPPTTPPPTTPPPTTPPPTTPPPTTPPPTTPPPTVEPTPAGPDDSEGADLAVNMFLGALGSSVILATVVSFFSGA